MVFNLMGLDEIIKGVSTEIGEQKTEDWVLSVKKSERTEEPTRWSRSHQ